MTIYYEYISELCYDENKLHNYIDKNIDNFKGIVIFGDKLRLYFLKKISCEYKILLDGLINKYNNQIKILDNKQQHMALTTSLIQIMRTKYVTISYFPWLKEYTKAKLLLEIENDNSSFDLKIVNLKTGEDIIIKNNIDVSGTLSIDIPSNDIDVTCMKLCVQKNSGVFFSKIYCITIRFSC